MWETLCRRPSVRVLTTRNFATLVKGTLVDSNGAFFPHKVDGMDHIKCPRITAYDLFSTSAGSRVICKYVLPQQASTGKCKKSENMQTKSGNSNPNRKTNLKKLQWKK